MEISVRVVGHAVEFFPGRRDRFTVVMDGPADVRGLIARLGVSPALVMTAIVDGRRRDFSYPLSEGAEVILMTPPAGG